MARKLGLEEILAINAFAIENCMPKLTFYFDIEPEKGLARILKNNDREVNRLDKESLEFHYLVREGYLKLEEMYPQRIVRINADQPLENVVSETKNYLFDYLKNHLGEKL